MKKIRPKCSRSGKTSACSGQEGPARVDEVDAREVVLLGDLLGAQVLLHGEREVRAALDRGVVRDDDAAAALDHADPGHDAGRRRLAVVDVPGGEGVQLEECRAGVDEQVDALARRELAARRGGARSPARRRRRRRAPCAPAARRAGLPCGLPASRTRRRRDRPCSSTPSSSRRPSHRSPRTAVTQLP